MVKHKFSWIPGWTESHNNNKQKNVFEFWSHFDHPFQVNSLFLEIKVYFFLWKKLTWRPLIHQNSKNSWTRKSSSSFQLEWPWKAFYVVSIHLWIWSWTSRLEPTKPGKLENSRKKKIVNEWIHVKNLLYIIYREKESIGMIVVRGNSCVMMEAKDRIFWIISMLCTNILA